MLSTPAPRRFVLGFLLVACSSAEDAEETPPVSEPAALFGTITVHLREARAGAEASSVVSGTVYDGPSPLDFGLAAVLEEGECQLREVTHPFCDPSCESGTTCVRDGECMPYPRAQNVGVLSVSGLLRPVTLEPFPPSFFYQSEELPFPPCAEGDTVHLRSEAFEADARCVAPLVVDAETEILVREDEPVTLDWQPAGDPELAEVHVLLDVSHHGGKRGDIVCTVPDTGHYDIPASLVTPLLELGLAGYPSVILTRFTKGTSSPADVQFRVAASVERAVDTGVRSCVPNSEDDCPSGQTCDPATNVCR